MRPTNRCYTIQTSRKCEDDTPKSTQANYKRLYSLQKIRINPKGLPNDFFRHLVSSREPTRNPRKHTKNHTISVETEQIRTTPQFQDSVITEGYQPRQYKSEERKDRIDTKGKPFTEQEIKIEKQYTFSQSFFEEAEQRLQKSKGKYHVEKKCAKKGVWQQESGVSSVQKRELTELASRKYQGRQKYLNWQYSRAVQPKPKNTLPILKARFPSAFGS